MEGLSQSSKEVGSPTTATAVSGVSPSAETGEGSAS